MEDIECIHQVRSGNIGAFATIVNRYKGLVFNIVSKITSNRQHAEDITQEVFIKVFQSLDRFKEKAKFSTWLYSITYNTAISAARKAKNKVLLFKDGQPDFGLDASVEDPDEASKEEQLQCLEKVLTQLTAEDALLISLYYTEDLPVADIAEVTSLSQSNVKTRLHRIRKYMNVEISKLLKKHENR